MLEFQNPPGLIAELGMTAVVTPLVMQNFLLGDSCTPHVWDDLRVPECVITAMWRVNGRTSVCC